MADRPRPTGSDSVQRSDTGAGRFLTRKEATGTYASKAGPNVFTGTQDFTGATVTGIAGGGTLSDGSVTLPKLASGVLSYFDRKVWIDVRDYGAVLDGTTDNTTAFNNAVAAASTGSRGSIFVPPGVLRIDGITSFIPGSVTLRGAGRNYGITVVSNVDPNLTLNSVIVAGATMSRLIQLGNAPSSSLEVDAGASMCDITIEGAGLADTVVKTAGRRNYVERCTIHKGALRALWINGQNNYILFNAIGNAGLGDTVYLNGQNDHRIIGNQLRSSGTTGACIHIRDNSKVEIADNHLWQDANTNNATGAGNLIWLDAAGATMSGFIIEGNTIEQTVSDQIKLTAASGLTLSLVNIVGNDFYVAGTYTDLSLSAVNVSGAGVVTDVTMTSNTVNGLDGAHRHKALITSSVSTIGRVSMIGNVGGAVAAIYSGFTPNYNAGNQVYGGTATIRDDNRGKATLSGTGAQTAFTIAHSMGATPSQVIITPGSADAKGDFYATADGTNITVTYGTAPASGTNNVVLNWMTKL